MINWVQIGEDFAQKYEGTFCRYVSPVTQIKEVFQILEIIAHADEPPSIVLFNKKHGEVYLNYTTEAELDFTFPNCGYFQHHDRALLFSRLFPRQWKKGICSATANVHLPYFVYGGTNLDEDNLASAFNSVSQLSVTQAVKKIKTDDLFSLAISPQLSVGLGKGEELWLWFESDLIGDIKYGNVIEVKTSQFKQEVLDHCRQTGDYAARVL